MNGVWLLYIIDNQRSMIEVGHIYLNSYFQNNNLTKFNREIKLIEINLIAAMDVMFKLHIDKLNLTSGNKLAWGINI